MATINVKDADNLTVALEKPLPPARAAAANSRPVVLSNEDLAVLNTINESLNDIEAAVESTDPVIIDHSTTGIGHGITTVTTAGTDVALAANTPAKWVIIQAQTDNTGRVAVGATGVDAVVATGTGISLTAGESIALPCENLADIFIDALVSTEGVRYIYGI